MEANFLHFFPKKVMGIPAIYSVMSRLLVVVEMTQNTKDLAFREKFNKRMTSVFTALQKITNKNAFYFLI